MKLDRVIDSMVVSRSIRFRGLISEMLMMFWSFSCWISSSCNASRRKTLDLIRGSLARAEEADHMLCNLTSLDGRSSVRSCSLRLSVNVGSFQLDDGATEKDDCCGRRLLVAGTPTSCAGCPDQM